jgi:hypothetical protein
MARIDRYHCNQQALQQPVTCHNLMSRAKGEKTAQTKQRTVSTALTHIQRMSDQKRQSSPSTIQADGSEELLWDVQEILAERTSISGENEFLVVWKTSWVPVSNMMQDGPEMRRFRDAPKCKFVSPAGSLYVEFQPGTTLASDCDTTTIEAQRFRAEKRARNHEHQVDDWDPHDEC